jgi:hypothetical protein
LMGWYPGILAAALCVFGLGGTHTCFSTCTSICIDKNELEKLRLVSSIYI